MAKAAKVEDFTDALDDDDVSLLEFSEDISEAEAPEPLPEREYPAVVKKAEVKLSGKGTRYIEVMFFIDESDYPADYDVSLAPGGKDVRFILGAEDNPQSRHRMRKFCEAVGAPMSRTIRVADWEGLRGKVAIKHDEYEGIKREKIQRVDRE